MKYKNTQNKISNKRDKKKMMSTTTITSKPD